MKHNAICGYQKQNINNLQTPIKVAKSEVEVFTNKIGGKKWGRSYMQQRKLIANRIFERGYREYLKNLKK